MISGAEEKASHRATEKKKKIEISPYPFSVALWLCGKNATAIAPIAARMINVANPFA
jgi:hypothetical protein